MIRRELPQTSDASPARPVANVRRGFSFVLAAAAADLVLELDCLVQRFYFFLSGKIFVLSFRFSSHCRLWCAGLLGLDRDGPDKAQQFPCDRSHDLSVILAGHS